MLAQEKPQKTLSFWGASSVFSSCYQQEWRLNSYIYIYIFLFLFLFLVNRVAYLYIIAICNLFILLREMPQYPYYSAAHHNSKMDTTIEMVISAINNDIVIKRFSANFKKPCNIRGKSVQVNQKAFQCTICDRWCHKNARIYQLTVFNQIILKTR